MDDHSEIGDDLGARLPLPNGKPIDHYVIKGVLGAGGFGITYLAEHSRLGKKYAIKEYFPQAFSRRDGMTVRPTGRSGPIYHRGLENFTSEARALAKFKHPAILDVTHIFEENGTAYIVLAFEQGRDMAVWLRSLKRPPTQEELDALLGPLLNALEEIHKRDLLHRDIAPDNVLIRTDGSPVLIDFGSAREAVRERPNVMSAIVKHGFSPPEQYSTQPGLQGPWTDIYGLSATLFMAITGQKPPEAMERMMQENISSIAQLAPNGYRPDFLTAIDLGLRLRPEERPQSVAAWRSMLLRGVNPHSGAPAASLRTPSGPSGPPRKTPTSRATARRAASRPSSLPPVLPPASVNGVQASATPSIRLTETGRPDLSGLDAAKTQPPADTPDEPAINPRTREVYLGALGLVAGSVGGALCSILLASIFSSRCFADSCLMGYLLPYTLVGATAGIAAGIYYAHLHREDERVSSKPDRF